MPVFTAIATALVGAIGLTGVAATIATGLIAGGLAIGVSKLIMPRGPSGSSQQEDSVTGSRIQLPPATNNKLPIVYGNAFVGGSIIDAKISNDLQTMWYVLALAEVTDSGTYSFGDVYYDGKLVTFGYGGAVTALTTNTAGGAETDTKINGNLNIYLFRNGSNSGVNTGGLSAIQIMSDPAIPADQRWDSSFYTSGGQSAKMSNAAFAIVKIKYNQDAGTTSLGAVTVKLQNTLNKPGDCIKDYLINSRYGCGVPPSAVDDASIAALNAYSDKPIYYTPMGGGPLTTQVRYRFNGPIDTTQSCLTNLQNMVDACDSWMQYSELTGKWKVVINKAYNETPNPTTLSNLYLVDNNNLVSGITVTPSDLNQTYNQVEYQYPNTNIRDQLDYIFIALQDTYPELLSQNEPLNKLIIKSDIVNNYVQGKFIAIRRLLQAREDLIITFQTDYSGIQVEAGDVIRVTNETYGWTEKLFRVSNVIEEKYPDGSLGARLTAFEYNNSIYDDDLDITDFIPEANTGLQDPNIIGTPSAPTVTVNETDTIAVMSVCATVPTTGLVTQLDFNYGTSNNSASHLYYTSVSNANGAPLTSGSTQCIDATDLAANNYYWSVTARNTTVGVRSGASSNSVSWNGPTVTTYNPVSNTGGINYNYVQANGITYTNLAPYAPGKIWNDSFDIQNYGTYQNAQTRTSFFTPFFIDGSSVTQPGSTKYWPWGQGTATTSEGFTFNSIARFNPLNNSSQVIVDGSYGWYVLNVLDFSTDLLTTDEVVELSLDTYVQVNDNFAHIQYCPFIINAGDTRVVLATSFQWDEYLNAPTGVPANSYQFNHKWYNYVTGSADIKYFGIATRNLSNTIVFYNTSTFTGKQSKVSA